jgi:hypothetical protein
MSRQWPGHFLGMSLFIVFFFVWAGAGALFANPQNDPLVMAFVKEIHERFTSPSFVDQMFSRDALLLVANSKGKEKERYEGREEIKEFCDGCVRKFSNFKIEPEEVDITGDTAHARCTLSFRHPIVGSKTGVLFAELRSENSRWVIIELILRV